MLRGGPEGTDFWDWINRLAADKRTKDFGDRVKEVQERVRSIVEDYSRMDPFELDSLEIRLEIGGDLSPQPKPGEVKLYYRKPPIQF